jgi:FtsZ-binding cell division protein ZapB
MGKFLRVLVILIFLLTAASLTLACLLFTKREILKGRTQKLEQGLIKIARTLEAEPPAVPEEPETYPARDVSDCTEEANDNPTRSEFWDSYKTELESLDQNIVDLKSRTRDLMSYYKIDPVTTKPARHEITNLRISDGEGTTQGVIDDVLDRAKAQYDLLTETRQQLTTIRTEFIDTINELNGRKATLREKLAVIVDLNNQIASLNNTIADLRNQIEELNEQVRSLEGDIANLQQEKEILEEENESLKIKSEELTGIIKELRGQLAARMPGGGGIDVGSGAGTFATTRVEIAPGVKGTIASVDQEHLFVVMDLSPEFIEELLSVIKDGRLPLIELLVKRGEDVFITKVRIRQLKQDQHLAIGDILSDWQQQPIEVGDLIFLQ